MRAPGKQPRLAEDLKAVADSQHQASTIGKSTHRFHHRRELRNRPGSQVIAVGESAGNDDGIAIFQIMRFVPEKTCRLFGDVLDGPVGIVVAVRPGKDDDSKFHLRFLDEGFVASLTRVV